MGFFFCLDSHLEIILFAGAGFRVVAGAGALFARAEFCATVWLVTGWLIMALFACVRRAVVGTGTLRTYEGPEEEGSGVESIPEVRP